jgi:glycosyltransferase A (GT-A) superfamily protein (DUF2064 family)
MFIGKMIVTAKIDMAKPAYSDADLAAVELWLKTNIMAALPTGVSATYTWHNNATVTATVIFEWTKDTFVEADFAAMRTWIQNHIIANLPNNGHCSYVWTIAS